MTQTVDGDQFAFPVTASLAGQVTGEPQWRLEALQMVNWGGFEGHTSVEFDPESAMISGGSGTGKSTMLDAYTALMMPFKVPFNGASNDSGRGRARDEAGGQRTLLTYLRGKVGNTDEGGGAKSAKLLRGKGRATWGAVAGTFVNTDGTAFTAARVYYVPASAHDVAGIAQHMLTYDGRLDLAGLGEPMSRFVPSSQQLGKILAAAVPGLRRHDTYDRFSATLFTKLAIGVNGDGENALDLLARIQASKSISSVTDLYRNLVLDTPATFAAADLAIDHFDSLENSYRKMETAANKAAVLRDIPAIHDRLVRAGSEVAELDTFGVTRHGEVTPLHEWTLRLEDRILEQAVDTTLADKRGTLEHLRTVAGTIGNLESHLAATRTEHREKGGDQLETLAAQIEAAQATRDTREADRARLAGTLRVLDGDVTTREGFDALNAAAAEFLDSFPAWEAAHTGQQADLFGERGEAERQRRELAAEMRDLGQRTGRIPGPLNLLRTAVAEASGIDVDELPFLAELTDIAHGEEKWRLAVETVLGGDARRLLVPADRYQQFSSAIDRHQLRGRITFTAATPDVPLTHPLTGTEDAGEQQHVTGKLVFADHRYAGWIQRRLTQRNRNARCVETARDLDGDGFRVTRAGQTRNGTDGAHGRGDSKFVIGFDNASLLEEYAQDLHRLETQIADIDTRLGRLGDAAAVQRQRRDAYLALGQYMWEQVDVAAAEQVVTGLVAQRDRIRDADDRLAELDQLIIDLGNRRDAAIGERRLLDGERDRLETRHGDLVTKLDVVRRRLEDIEDSGQARLTDDQAARLDVEFKAAVEPGDPASYEDLDVHLAHLHKWLAGALEIARLEVQRSEDALVRVFTHYQGQWEDPNLGISVASYPDYLQILEEIEAGGLSQTQEAWQRKLTEWSGQDLVPLATVYRNAVNDIENRIAPINEILSGLEFGARGGRLEIKVERLALVPVTKFLTRLRKLSSTATAEMDFDEAQRRFVELADFMSLLRDGDDPRYDREKSDRSRLLDVRRHVQVSAVEKPQRTGDWLPREYTMLGETSGGETQELVAFIIGSALRFRLGDQLRTRSRFAPVFLDEGFVKADARFAGRAIAAWHGLGFQIIVGTPEDKVTGLEPHMNQVIGITKDHATGYSYVHPVKDAPPTRPTPPVQSARPTRLGP